MFKTEPTPIVKKKKSEIDIYHAMMKHDLNQFKTEKEVKRNKKKEEQAMWGDFLKTQMQAKLLKRETERSMNQSLDNNLL
jgi:hypothetical protein